MRLNLKLAAFFVVLVAAGLVVFGRGETFGLTTMPQQLLVISGLVIVFLIVVMVYVVLVRNANRKAAMLDIGWADVNPVPDETQPTTAPLTFLRDQLRALYGLRWRYRLPWLLVVGDEATICRFLPDLAEHGWLVAQDAVLLWSNSDQHGHPDEKWLRQLYKLRPRRPVDAIVVALDGTTELPAQRRATHTYNTSLSRIAESLHWAAPLYVLDIAQTDAAANCTTPVIGCEFPRAANVESIEAALVSVRDQLADRSVAQLCRNSRDRYTAELSERLDTRSAPLASWIAGLSSRRRHQSIRGVFFAPYPLNADRDEEAPTSADLPLWQHIGDAARAEPGRRIGWHPVTVFSIAALSMIGLWNAGMLISALSNARELHITKQALQTLATTPDPAARLRALLALQQRIDLYEDRIQHRAPLLTRFGLNHDTQVLTALWTPYSQAARRALVTPIQQSLEAELKDLGQMQTTQLDERTNKLALDGYKTLKAYLMMADPGRADAAFMTPLLMPYWHTTANLPIGEKLDLSERLINFYARHLPVHADWRIRPRTELVNASQQTLLAVIGVKNSEDTLYESIREAVGNKYPDHTLSSLTAGTDTRGLFRTSVTVPGAFTREAYEGTIAAAIDAIAKRSDVTGDWVLSNVQNVQQHPPAQSADALKLELTERYFAEYTDHWQGFMNTLQWEPASTLPAAIEQLKLMADARQSPVIALMKSLEYQGGAGALKESLSDTLVTKARNVFDGKISHPERAKPDPVGPLGVAFGPVLRLVAPGNGSVAGTGTGSNSDLSLQRFMERVTALRLKLQQISDSPDADAQAKQVAQSLFQGKNSELADTRAYAQLMAASLGAQWAGMGDALFVRPVLQATQTILQPAQASLNEAWRQAIVTTWNRSFAGRYPFANTDNDASLPELARFLRPQGGLIEAFLSTQLAGVLELQGDQWVPAATGSVTATLDPAFLDALNTLQRIAVHLLAEGEPQYRFELKPVPTPGVTDTVLTLDGQKLHYYNQRETWQALTWPSNDPHNPGTRLQWQTEQAGTNKNFEFIGRWGWMKMLERARVEAVDNATFHLTWRGAPDTSASKHAQAAMAEPALALAPSQASASASAQAQAQAQAPAPALTSAPAPELAPTPSAVSDTGSTNASGKDEETNIHARDNETLIPHGPLTPPSHGPIYPLSYMMRTDVGKGPLELLALRGFVLPKQIFVSKAPVLADSSQANH